MRTFAVGDYADNLIEHVMPGSYMKSVHLKTSPEQSFFVGPLARACANASFATPKASALLTAFKATAQTRGVSALDNIEARLIEMVYCAEMLQSLAGNLPAGGITPKENRIGKGRYIGIVEAPRGILIHDYTADDAGLVTKANMIVATQNNYDAINTAITGFARAYIGEREKEMLLNGVEFALRCFDPCLACATHAFGQMPMELEIRQRGTVCATYSRKGTV
jgi:coenzyme F420-reducing hydrogenase alpha subunit